MEVVNGQQTDDRARVRSLLDEAAAGRTSDPVRARRAALEARVLARAADLPLDEAEALYQLASIHHHDGNVDDAFSHAIEAVRIAERCDPSVTLAWALHLVGVVYYQSGNFADALERCLRALDVYRASGDEVNEGKILHTIAAIHQSMGDYDTAISTYEHALATNETRGRRDLDAMIVGNLARIRGRRGEYLPAVSLGQQAVDLAREHAPQLVGGLLADLAEAYVGLSDHANAALCFAEARADWEYRAEQGEVRSPSEQLGVLVSEARVALRGDQVDEAIAKLTDALHVAERAEARESELEIHDLLATSYKRALRPSLALEHRERQFALHRELTADSADLRMRTMQVVHADETSRQKAEITLLRSTERRAAFDARDPDSHVVEERLDGPVDEAAVDAYHLEAFERLAALAESRGGTATKHTHRVGDLAAEIGHALGRAPAWCERLRLAARLHDIGKIAVTDHVVVKPGPLDLHEFDEMKQHTVLGKRLLSGVSTELFQMAAEIAWSHHEWWDGSGYPNGLDGLAIPATGRIVAIADVFDSLVSRRSYKREWSVDEAVRFIVSGSGQQFDPELVDAFCRVMRARGVVVPGRSFDDDDL